MSFRGPRSFSKRGDGARATGGPDAPCPGDAGGVGGRSVESVATSPGTRRRNTILHGILGLALAAILLGILFRETDWTQVAEAVRELRLGWLLVAQLLLWASFFARAQRWTYVVRSAHPASYRSLFSASQIGILINFMVPARLGELVRARILSRLTGLEMATSLATIALDNLADVIGLMAILLLSALALAGDVDATFAAGTLGNTEPLVISSDLVRAAGLAVATVVALSALVLVVLYAWRDRVLEGIRRLVEPVSPALAGRVTAVLADLVRGMRVLRSSSDVVRVTLWSLVTWGCGVGAVGATLVAFAIQFPWYTPFLMLSLIAVAIAVPLTPGTVGQFHLPAVAGLLIGVPELSPARAKAVAIVDHLSTLLPVAVLGIYCILRERLGVLELVRNAQTRTD